MSGENLCLEKKIGSKLIFLLLMALSGTVLGIVGNVYFHEVGHYLVAKAYDLEPEMHFTTGNSDGGLFSIIMSNEFKAFVRFNATKNQIQNLLVTSAGPLVNLFFSIVLAVLYFGVLRKLKKNKDLYVKKFWVFLMLDVVFVSFFIPSILSFVINMSLISGSDGTVIYSLIRQIFFS
ncbi:MAG: site-2 protease family protein [Candidatus Woesearchaeota archaeon]